MSLYKNVVYMDLLSKEFHVQKLSNREIAHLNIRIISWSPSPFRKRSLLALNIRDEHKQLKRFSMNSNSSEVVGSYRLYS